MSKSQAQTRKKTVISKDQVKHVAKLANLELTEKEVIRFQKQLSDILEYVSRLDELDTEGVEPTGQVTGLENIFREDESAPSLSQEEALSGARKKKNGFFEIRQSENIITIAAITDTGS